MDRNGGIYNGKEVEDIVYLYTVFITLFNVFPPTGLPTPVKVGSLYLSSLFCLLISMGSGRVA